MLEEIKKFIANEFPLIIIDENMFQPTCLFTPEFFPANAIINLNIVHWIDLGYNPEQFHIALLHELGHYIDFNYRGSIDLVKRVRNWQQHYAYTGTFPNELITIELNAWRIAIEELFPRFNIEINAEVKYTIYKALRSYRIQDNEIDELFLKAG